MRRAGENIRNGTSVIIFPEGARSYRREMGPFQKGAFLLALEAGVPIVPVTIIDAYEVINEERRMARPGEVHIVIGSPIPLEGKTRRDLPELMETVRRAIEQPLLEDFEGAHGDLSG
jgi:1-acyl-sn-glycerol-3-phosphate acyltransferase